MQGRCTRENCKYLHPPPHLKTQLEINGRNTLATQKMLQNLQNQQLAQQVVGLPNMNLPLQPSPASALLAGNQGVPAAPGQSTPVVIPTSQYHHIPSKDSSNAATVAAANAAAASLYQQQHAPSQMTYNGLQILTQPPYHTLPGVPVTAGQGQPQVHTSQASTDTSAMYGGYHFFPVAVSMNSDSRCSHGGFPYSQYAVSMAPSMQPSTHSSASPYGSYFMPFPNPGGLGGLSNPAAMGQMLDLQGLQSQVIPGPGGQGLPILPSMKPKNDKLELPTTSESLSLKRPRDPSDDALLLAPPPSKKSITGGLPAPQGSAPMMNFLPHTQFPYPSHLNNHMLPTAHQPTPVVPTPFPVMPSIAPGMPGQGLPLFGQHMLSPQVHTHRPQSNETIPVCRDFKSGSCKRPSCKYAHVTEDYVEIIDGKVTLCRYAVQNRCTRQRCKFYHPPPATTHLTMLPPTVPIPALPATGISSV